MRNTIVGALIAMLIIHNAIFSGSWGTRGVLLTALCCAFAAGFLGYLAGSRLGGKG